MTPSEFELEFDLLYNNINSNRAPGVDIYEKSVFLTQAQETVVTTLYNTFEKDEATREYLSSLLKVITYKTGTAKTNTDNFLSTSQSIYVLPKDLMFIVYEDILPQNNECYKDNINVKAVQMNDLPRMLKNPFTGPNSRQALRVNLNDGKGNDCVEIYSTYSNFWYKLGYLSKPEPIILYTQNDDCGNLTINGVSAGSNPKGCLLNTALHRTILETAVQNATAAYKSITTK